MAFFKVMGARSISEDVVQEAPSSIYPSS